MRTWPTLTATLAWIGPLALVAVRVYVVVVVGDTVVLPLAATWPTPLMLTVEAPVVVQLRVACWPGLMLTGLASKRMICGLPAAAGPTWTATVAVVVPFGPV